MPLTIENRYLRYSHVKQLCLFPSFPSGVGQMPARFLASLMGCGFTLEQAKEALYSRAPQLTQAEIESACKLAIQWHKESVVSR